MTPTTPEAKSPKTRAEAMARTLFTEWHSETQVPVTAYQRELLVERIYTALEKLIAENENLKNGWPHEQPLVDMPMDRQIVMLNRQLAATEERLREIVSVYRAHDVHVEDCDRRGTASDECLEKSIVAAEVFLSTLTAEKKEEGK